MVLTFHKQDMRGKIKFLSAFISFDCFPIPGCSWWRGGRRISRSGKIHILNEKLWFSAMNQIIIDPSTGKSKKCFFKLTIFLRWTKLLLIQAQGNQKNVFFKLTIFLRWTKLLLIQAQGNKKNVFLSWQFFCDEPNYYWSKHREIKKMFFKLTIFLRWTKLLLIQAQGNKKNVFFKLTIFGRGRGGAVDARPGLQQPRWATALYTRITRYPTA
jgi:hypothetical protein